MFYVVKTPWWLKAWYPSCIWSMPGTGKKLYLSFDDGPHPVITGFVLDELKKYNAKATFFCIGKNVLANPVMYGRILDEGHAVGNHSFNHYNGWKTEDAVYLNDIAEAKKYIDSDLYRPPYGRITKFQLARLEQQRFKLKTVMWSVLSGDFDTAISGEKCWKHIEGKCKPGSIVVFHDSEKAEERLRYALPRTLEHYSRLGFSFEKIVADP